MKNETDFTERKDRTGSGKIKFTKLTFFDEHNYPISAPICGQKIKIKLDYITNSPLNNVASSISFNSLYGENRIVLRSDLVGVNYQNIPPQGSFECVIDRFPLSPGTYSVNCYAEETRTQEILDFLQQACITEVHEGDYFATGKLPHPDLLSVCVDQKWS